jgi:branched-chain amino acid aminotransferase
MPAGFDVSTLVAYVNGEIVKASEAKVSVFDHGLLYGDGVFEGMRVREGRLFRPRDHLARLRGSARALQMEVPLDDEGLLDAIAATVNGSNLLDAHIRVVLSRGFGAPGLDPDRCERQSLIVTAYPFPPLLGVGPVRLVTSPVVRKSPGSLGPHVKSLNYLDAIMAKLHAKACGADDALMVDHLGAVAECSAANIFLLVDEELRTPTLRAVLPGITRRTIIELAEEQGVAVRQVDIWPNELDRARAAFLTGTGAGLVAVGSIDGYALEGVANPLFTSLVGAYRSRTLDPSYSMDITGRTASGVG